MSETDSIYFLVTIVGKPKEIAVPGEVLPDLVREVKQPVIFRSQQYFGRAQTAGCKHYDVGTNKHGGRVKLVASSI